MLLYFIIFLSCSYYTLTKIIKTSTYIQTRNLLINTKKYDNSYQLYLDICSLILQIKLQTLFQSLFSSVKKTDEIHEISYYYGSSKYIIPIEVGKPKLYPIKVHFYTKIGNLEHNVNNSLSPYAGPHYNFHNLAISPKYFSLTNLIVKIDDEIYKIFKEKDIITISI